MSGLQPQADTLDIVTQLVSMMSILVAQYVHTSKTTYGSEGGDARAFGTVMFVVSNTVLLVAHAVLVAVPLWKKVSASYASVQERFAAGANKSIIVGLKAISVICGDLTMWAKVTTLV